MHQQRDSLPFRHSMSFEVQNSSCIDKKELLHSKTDANRESKVNVAPSEYNKTCDICQRWLDDSGSSLRNVEKHTAKTRERPANRLI